MSSLDVWMNGRHVGVWRQIRGDRDQFVYAATWVEDPQFRALSLSLPLTASREITSPFVRNYFDNLLPDNPRIRDRIQARYGTRSSEAFDLLEAIGRDCAGAVQLMPEGQVPTGWDRIESKPLTTQDVAALLRAVTTVDGPFGAENADDDFRISIAGAQEKTALLRIGHTWHRPIGATPTTHILKLPLGIVGGGLQLDLSDSVDNEWLCSALFEALGLPVARAEIGIFGDQRVLVVERFDRQWQDIEARNPYAARFKPRANTSILRLPQEDFCQAVGCRADDKYEKDGGPGMARILGLLARGAAPDRDSTLFALTQLVFWLLAATDGHAKNFSIFLLRTSYTLTPVYDVLSTWPVMGNKAGQLSPQKVRMAMAMRTGASPHSRWKEIQPRHFRVLARSLPDQGAWRKMVMLAESVPQAIAAVEKRLPRDFKESVWTRITTGMISKTNDFLVAARAMQD